MRTDEPMLTPERRRDEVRPRTWAVRIVLSIGYKDGCQEGSHDKRL